MKKLLIIVGLLTGINCKAQIITTVVGGGAFDGIIALNASLNTPIHTAIDAAGNIYIADSGHNRIRKVTASTGIISTIAGNGTAAFAGDGGAAISASLYNPQGLAIDTAGNIYIADCGNNRIRKITASTGIISTVAGNGTIVMIGNGVAATSASLYGPSDVALDAAGNIYIADCRHFMIRKVYANNGFIYTVAGNATAAYAGDGGAATIASLNYPVGVALDAVGNIYIADTDNQRIRKVTASTGKISTVAGNGPPDGYGGGGTATYAGDGGPADSSYLNNPARVAVDAAGNIYIADTDNQRIRKITASTGIINTIAGNGIMIYSGDGGAAISASLYFPTGIALDTAGDIYIADQGNNRIRKVTASTGIISTVAGNGAVPSTGDGGAAIYAGLYSPAGLVLDAAGNIFIADYNANRIRKVTASTGIISTVAGNGTAAYAGDGGAATSASLNNPQGVAIDAAGNIFIADEFNGRIRKVTASTGIISTVAGNGDPFSSPGDGDGGAATSASLGQPIGLALDAAGNIYIADNNVCRIRKVTASTGIISTVAGNGMCAYAGDGGAATSASLDVPSGIALDAAGNIYIAIKTNPRIRKVIASTGIISTIAGNGTAAYAGDGGAADSASLNYPAGLALDAAGNLFIADEFNSRIRKVTTSTGIISTVVGNGIVGFGGDGGLADSASLSYIEGVAVDAAGNIYIADTDNERIRKVSASFPSNCIAHYTTTYDSLQNSFNLTVDSATTAMAVSYLWDFDDGSTSTLATPSHTYSHDSLYNVCMKIFTSTGDSCSYCHVIGKDSAGVVHRAAGFTLNIHNANGTTGILQQSKENGNIAIYPNPSSGKFMLVIANEVKQSQLEITNILGERVYQSVISNGVRHLNVDLSNHPNGIYFINIKTEQGLISKKIIINR